MSLLPSSGGDYTQEELREALNTLDNMYYTVESREETVGHVCEEKRSEVLKISFPNGFVEFPTCAILDIEIGKQPLYDGLHNFGIGEGEYSAVTFMLNTFAGKQPIMFTNKGVYTNYTSMEVD